jgi:hypothetical protein
VAPGLAVNNTTLLRWTSEQHRTIIMRYLQPLVLPHYSLRFVNSGRSGRGRGCEKLVVLRMHGVVWTSLPLLKCDPGLLRFSRTPHSSSP